MYILTYNYFIDAFNYFINVYLLANGNNNNQQIYWDIQLDQDLLETIINIYPEWFQEENIIAMTEDSKQTLIPLLQNRDSKSPPKSEVDDASIKKAMDKNKESLKVKLMLRRPISQLIEQGIIPRNYSTH